jgi:hypothetical protein
MKICLLAILLMTLSGVLAIYGINNINGTPLTPDQYQCFKESTYTFTYINIFVTDK